MKKLLVLLMVLVLTAAAGTAWADKLEIAAGSPTQCDIDTFKILFITMEQQTGYNFSWEPGTRTEGAYTVFTAKATDGSMILDAYTLNNMVVYVVCEGSITVNMSDTQAATQFGSWFGASIGGITLSYYIFDHPDEALDDSLGNRFTEDATALLSSLSGGFTDDSQLRNGVVVLGTVLGYPVGLEISGASLGTIATMTMRMAVTSTDGILSAGN